MRIKVNKTKIVATWGPSCSSEQVMLQMISEGVDVFRFNFSHGTHAQHLEGINKVRTINEKHGLNIGILADLQGPKIRLGEVANEYELLKTGDEIIMSSQKGISTSKILYVSYELLEQDVKPGEVILIDDGKVKVQVISTNKKDKVKAKVLNGGKISSHKGVNFPNTKTTVPALTAKDKKDLKFAIEQDVNWIALSFVRSPKDIQDLKRILGNKNSYIKVMSKIEKPEALEALDDIIKVSDGIMIARGDLAVEVAQERMPLIQKDIINRCLKFAKPVVVATQMMESMIENPSPTRAEITDVANAVIDGADAVMLSGETSVGKHPVKVIDTMESIIRNIEKAGIIYNKELRADKNSPTFVSDAICYNAARISAEVGARAITGMTFSGYTAFMLSSYRPKAKIFIFTENKQLLNSLSICWGVYSFYYNKFQGTDSTIKEVIGMMKKKKYLSNRDFVVNVGSMPLANRGRANMIKVTVVD